MKRLTLSVALVMTLAAACKSRDNTGIVVEVWSDLAIPVQLNTVRIEVLGPTASHTQVFPISGQGQLPVRLAVVPRADKDASILVRATGLLGATEVVQQSARVSFVSGSSKLLTLTLDKSCANAGCTSTQSCSAGVCLAIPTIPNLPDYKPRVDAGVRPSNDASLDGSADAGAVKDTGSDQTFDGLMSDGPFSDGRPDQVTDVPLGTGGAEGGTTGTGGATGGSVGGGGVGGATDGLAGNSGTGGIGGASQASSTVGTAGGMAGVSAASSGIAGAGGLIMESSSTPATVGGSTASSVAGSSGGMIGSSGGMVSSTSSAAGIGGAGGALSTVLPPPPDAGIIDAPVGGSAGGASSASSTGGAGSSGSTGGAGGASTTPIVYCGMLTGLANGSLSVPASTVGSVATYSCDSGYHLVGGSTRTCQSDGTWSGTAPTCVLSTLGMVCAATSECPSSASCCDGSLQSCDGTNLSGDAPGQGQLVVSGDGLIVTDTLTGLVWQRDGSGERTGCGNGMCTWAQAKAYCTGLTLGGLTGWRLPGRNELVTLVDFTKTIPAIDRTAFPGTPSEWFWTSSPYAITGGNAWYVDFKYGTSYSASVSGAIRVRCVR